MKRVLIMGATSAIAEAVARRLAARGDALFLVARNAERLSAIASDLRLRGAAGIATSVLDARNVEAFPELIASASGELGGLDAALIAHGTLTDQSGCEVAPAAIADEFLVNALSPMVLSLHLAQLFASRGHGVIAAISSVAGDRGRQSNFVYGSAKAALTTFLSGLRQRLGPKGVLVVTIKPGFVISPMTAGFKHGLLWARPETVARDIVRAMDRGTAVVYTPWFWRGIMAVIRAIPEFIFRRLRL